MTWENDPYSILGLTPEATPQMIKAAYRKIAQRFHPDLNPHPAATRQFQVATAAYELLNSAVDKRKYDEAHAAAVQESDSYFTLQVTASKYTIIPLPEPQVIYLLAVIAPAREYMEKHEHGEARLNLTLILDRSNSMNGVRMEKVKIAAHQIIDNMSNEDVISIITFNDRADVVIPATRITDRPALKANVTMISAAGGTEIYQGLSAGMDQVREYYSPRMVNHMILLTDGHTFGDQHLCIQLAETAAQEGIGISAMGLGHDWNDEFLDQIASITGGNSTYINSASAVAEFLDDRVRSLVNAFAERVTLSIAPDTDTHIEEAFKLSPHPQPLTVEDGHLTLGSLQTNRPLSVLLQLQMPGSMAEGQRQVARLVAEGDILANQQQHFLAVGDVMVEVNRKATGEYPPMAILDARSKLTL